MNPWNDDFTLQEIEDESWLSGYRARRRQTIMRLISLCFVFALSCTAQVGITITPAAAIVPPGGTVQFVVAVTGSANFGSTSTITPAIGTFVARIAGNFDVLTYTAPAGVSAQAVTIKSAAHANSAVIATASITVASTEPLSAIYQWTLSPFALGAASLGIWAEAQMLEPGETCAVTWVVGTTGRSSYSGAASVSSRLPAVFIPVTVAAADELVAPPTVSLLCEDAGAPVISVSASPL